MKYVLKNTRERRWTIPKLMSVVEGPMDVPVTRRDELFQQRYELSTTVHVSFFSNPTQLEHKTAQAAKTMNAYLYRDIIPLVDELLLCVDDETALQVVLELKDVLQQSEVTT